MGRKPKKNFPSNKTFSSNIGTDLAFSLSDHLPYQIATASNLLAIQRDLDIKKACPLETREIRVLINIGSYGPVAAADVAYQSRMDSTIISRAVKVLTQQGYIVAQKGATNKKERLLALTAAGTEVYQKICIIMQDREDRIRRLLTKDEYRTMQQALTKIESDIEWMLAEKALSHSQTSDLSADQKEVIRWYRKSCREQQD